MGHDSEWTTLAAIVEHKGSLTVRDALGWTTRVAKTLAAIHAMGHVHGALSAEAIVVAGDDCAAQGLVLHPSDVAESAAYRARQRGGRERAVHQDDVWALSVILYLCLTGQLPYPQGVGAAYEQGRRHVPPMAPLGPHLHVVQLMMDRLLDPTAGDAEICTADELLFTMRQFSPATAALERLRLRPPQGAEHADRSEGQEEEQAMHSLPPAPLPAPSHRAPAAAPPPRSRGALVFALGVLAGGALVALAMTLWR